jgi:hypothetical protein
MAVAALWLDEHDASRNSNCAISLLSHLDRPARSRAVALDANAQ